MTYTPPPTPPPPPPPVAQPAGKDNTNLFGWIGIIGGLCCGLIGIVFGVLSIMQAKKWGNSPVLGYIALAVALVNIVAGAIWNVNRS
jgi:hypothetical protein